MSDLDLAVGFYSALFGTEPTVLKDDYAKWMVEKDDYAKWMVDDPRINFAITDRGRKPGVDHLGLQFDSEEDLWEFVTEATERGLTGHPIQDGACCYARSNKLWVADPDGLAWEGFHTHGSHESFGIEDITDDEINEFAAASQTRAQETATETKTSCC